MTLMICVVVVIQVSFFMLIGLSLLLFWMADRERGTFL